MLIAGALVFNYVVTVENIPNVARPPAERLRSDRRRRSCSSVNIILLVLGCLLEGSTIMLVIVPIFIPTAKALGIDLVHFGVVVVVNIMIGLLTPPYGLLLFVARANMTKQPLRRDRARSRALHHRRAPRARDHHRGAETRSSGCRG